MYVCRKTNIELIIYSDLEFSYRFCNLSIPKNDSRHLFVCSLKSRKILKPENHLANKQLFLTLDLASSHKRVKSCTTKEQNGFISTWHYLIWIRPSSSAEVPYGFFITNLGRLLRDAFSLNSLLYTLHVSRQNIEFIFSFKSQTKLTK